MAVTISTIQIKRSFKSGAVPTKLLEGEEFVNLADGFRMTGDGVTPPAQLPRIPYVQADQLPLSQAAQAALQGKLDATTAALLVLLDSLPALPSNPSAYPASGGLFRDGDANGFRLVRIAPSSSPNRTIPAQRSGSLQIGPNGDALGFDNPLYSIKNESTNAGLGNFGPSHVMIINKQGGTGNREGVHIELTSTGAVNNEQLPGGIAIGRIISGSGTAYGWNPYARVDAEASIYAQGIGQEINTDIRRAVAAKVGQQIVDVGTSTGNGTDIDTSFMMAKQVGAAGWKTGIQFGYNINDSLAGLNAGHPVQAGGTLINVLPTDIAFKNGIDFSNIFTPFTDAAIKLNVGMNIKFGINSLGGEIASLTATGGGKLLFGNAVTIFDFGGGQQHKFSNGDYTLTGFLIQANQYGPPSSTSPGTVGQKSWDPNYEYRCVAPNKWKRTALLDF